VTRTGSLRDTVLIETASVTRKNLRSALAVLHGCWKSSSLLWMQAHAFPVLCGLILGGWSRKSEEAVIRFCRERNVSDLLVRIEKPGQRWATRRGGYTIASESARSLVESLGAEGMVTILLEPASPYMDLFSLTSVCDVDTGKVDVEVVGPGFDASDILRGDINPHERFELSFDDRTAQSWLPTNSEIRRSYAVEDESYRASVQRRLVKIGARLRNPSYPDELMGVGASSSFLKALAEEAIQHLRKSGQTTLVDHIDEYEPIPTVLLGTFLNELLRLFQVIKASEVRWQTFSLAGSFLSQGRLVIWDFFPAGDQDTRVLCEL